MPDLLSRLVCVAVASLAAAASPARAQCGPEWLPGHGVPGVVQSANLPISASILWDPDGAGPEEQWLVVAGDFVFAGSVQTSGVARWKPSAGEWAPIGGGIPGDVRALAVLPNNDLVAAGAFAAAGGVAARNIARFDGEAWHPLGTGATNGANTTVLALAVLPSGDLIAAGGFSSVGGVAATRIARWDGSGWHALGSGLSGGSVPLVFALAVLPDGDLLAAGRFQQAGGINVFSIARWNGAAWSGFGQGLRLGSSPATVTSVIAFPDGSFVAGGDFNFAGGVAASCVARWASGAWSPLGGGIADPGLSGVPVRAFAVLPGGDLIVAGEFLTAGGITANHIARWNGSTWSGLGEGLVSGLWSETVRTLTVLPSGDLIAGGSVIRAGDTPVASLARWDDEVWHALSPGTDMGVTSLLALPEGGIVAGGLFSSIGGVTASRIAQWDGRAWAPMGAGLASTPGAAPGSGSVAVIRRHPSGDIIAGGSFRFAGGAPINALARWDGTGWSEIGGGLGPEASVVTALAISPTGDIAAAGSFTTAGGVPVNRIAVFDGTEWGPLGSGINGVVRALAYLPSGDLIAGGNFPTVDGQTVHYIASWNGSEWSGLGGGFSTGFSYTPEVFALLPLPSGDLVAAGRFDIAGGVPARSVARWDGAAWHPFGPGLSYGSSAAWVYDLALGPGGDILAAGNISEPGPVARWDGSGWAAYGPPLSPASATVSDVVSSDSGEAVIAGSFFLAGGHTSAFFARLSPTGAPWVAVQPVPQTVAPDAAVTLSAAAAEAYSGVTYQWRRDGQPIADGPGGASPGGGTVSGALGTLPSPTDGVAVTLTVTGVRPSDAGVYTVVFSSDCGSATSDPAALTVLCRADLTGDGSLTLADFVAFRNLYVAGDLAADFDGSGALTLNDFVLFRNDYVAGCP